MKSSANSETASRPLGSSSENVTIIRRWAWVRLVLGFLQMFGAVFSAVLIFRVGITPMSVAAVIGTGMVTGISRLLFHGRRNADQSKTAPYSAYRTK